ncbi:hypothetical protein BS47DRAFT_1368945 [Hydnum rufescens UP504]|uniref:Uncharacterized protein n=1 Tax=Hydnum rufescens UP504 TaxID=1448309 RepID=A0A9P6DGN5_9AGAM|nr:hypothetical protein BS47DRAFT_1368945 [Hydnum rufescens UP504]
MTTPRETKATNAPRQKNERQTKPRNEDARHRTTEPPDKPHTRFGGLTTPYENPIEEGTRPRYERVPHPPKRVWYYKTRERKLPPPRNDNPPKPTTTTRRTKTRNNAGTRMNHTSATAGVWFYTRYRLTTNTKMKTRQRNPPPGNDNAPPHGNQQRDPPKRVPNETRRTEEHPGPVQTTGPTVNRQATAPLPLKWPATSPPCPDEEAEGTTHPLGRFLRMVPHPLKRDGTTHPPMRVCGATK